MSFFHSFSLLIPILFMAAGGFLLSRLGRGGFSQATLVKVVTDFLSPMLIFVSLARSDISARLTLRLGAAASLVVLGLLGLCLIYCRIFRQDLRGFSPPVMFMNSGFIGIPLLKLAGGTAAMNLDIVYDQVQTLYIFTLGLLIITGGFSLRGLKEIIKTPILWSILGGFLFRFLGWTLPPALVTTLEFGGNAAPPLAAAALGAALAETRLRFDPHLLGGLALRFAGGFFLALASCQLLGLDGLEARVVLVASTLPSAVFSSVLPLRYGVKADFAGTMVVVSTLLGALTIPLVLILAERLF
jgi:predicted permease